MPSPFPGMDPYLEGSLRTAIHWFAFAWRLQVWMMVFGCGALCAAYGIGSKP